MRLLWGRDFMSWAESNYSLIDNQYGGRKGCQPQSVGLNNTLTMEFIRYYAEDTSICDIYASECYDLIVTILLAYTLLRLCLPIALVRFQCKWLENAAYSLRMQQGLTESYTSTENKFLYGTGQGTGWSPPSWISLSYIISKVMDEQSPGLRLTAPYPNVLELTLDVFVDDVNGGLTMEGLHHFQSQTATLIPKHTEVLEQTQANIKFYSQLLFTTGGKLSLIKCYVYLLRKIWKNGKRTFENPTKPCNP